MSSVNPGLPGGASSERGGNGSLGATPNDSVSTSGTGGASPSGPVGYGTSMPAGGDRYPGEVARGRRDDAHRSEFGDFLDDLSELARGGGHGDLRGEIERRVSQARTKMNAALDQGREMGTRAREQMSRGLDYSRDAVVERPLSSIALAAVGGLIVGLLLSRRD